MMKHILFVDDEPMVLNGLQRSFRPLRHEWSAEFASSGAEALLAIERQHFDAIVSDMRMPGMDGAELLNEVRKRSPQTIRMILSGQSDRETILRSINPAHQYVAKPCDTEELKSKISHAFALRDLLENPELRAMVSQLKTVPSVPSLYLEMMDELTSQDPSLARIAGIVARDIGMTARVLQVVNSAFFGLRNRVSCARHAVDLLGTDTVAAIVLSVHVFSQFETDAFWEADTAWLSAHSLSSANFARKIAQLERAEQHVMDDAFTAGILHDTGKLILASAVGKTYKKAIDLATASNRSLCAAEREVLGCTHAEIGAYLLGMWGLPLPIVEAVAWHHRPADTPDSTFSPLAAVHAAYIYDEEFHPSRLQDGVPLDIAFLQRLGLAERSQAWKQACQELLERRKKDGA